MNEKINKTEKHYQGYVNSFYINLETKIAVSKYFKLLLNNFFVLFSYSTVVCFILFLNVFLFIFYTFSLVKVNLPQRMGKMTNQIIFWIKF